MSVSPPQLSDLLQIDPSLSDFSPKIVSLYTAFTQTLQTLSQYEGGLDNFMLSYKELGVHVNQADNSITCREWGPNLARIWLAGDFNNWDKTQWELKSIGSGVWECIIPPDQNGECRFKEGTELRYFCEDRSGARFDRISPWARYATQKDRVYYNQVYLREEPYDWAWPPPPPPRSLYIYESHVGICTPNPAVSSYLDYADTVIPRIAKLGYNAVQLMAVMEHAYYASFGYQVTSFFAPSSRFGPPDCLRYLIDRAHEHGIVVLLDLVHSHASNNCKDGLNMFDGSDSHFFLSGPAGQHQQWNSRIFDYKNPETLRFLLSNLEYWVREFRFDGFRFDGVTSMLYKHHGISYGFSGGYHEYFNDNVDEGAIVYMMIANQYLHDKYPNLITIAEDVSGYPGLCRPVAEGGVGFDYRLAMSIPDMWIKLIKDTESDTEWDMGNIAHTLNNRRYKEKTIAYCESHDQALVGDKTLSFRLMDREMYTNMAVESPLTPTVDRGISLHKLIRLITFSLGGEGILTFMGNEFGHPEWLDFPREGNGESYQHCRRQYDLADNEGLRYKYLARYDEDLVRAEKEFSWLDKGNGYIYLTHESDKMIIFERGGLCFVLNFHWNSYPDYRAQVGAPGKYKVVLDSDQVAYGGHGRVGEDVEYFSFTEDQDKYFIKTYIPSRTGLVFRKVD